MNEELTALTNDASPTVASAGMKLENRAAVQVPSFSAQDRNSNPGNLNTREPSFVNTNGPRELNVHTFVPRRS